MSRGTMETCFLDLLDSLWGGGRANLKLSASGSRHSGSTWPMSILDSVPKVREKAHRKVCGRECVHVGGGESRVKGRKILNKAKHGEKQTLCGLLIVYTLVLVVSQDSPTLLTPDSWVLGCFLYFYLFKLLWVGFCYAQQKNITYYSWQ